MDTRLTASLGLVIFVLASTIALLVADRHFGKLPPDTTSMRDWCVELAMTSKYPTLFVEDRGCVSLVQEQSKRKES